MLIEKDNIIIRSADIKDAEVLNSWWNDGEIMEHAGFPNGLGESLETTRANLEKTNPFFYLCIIEIDNKKVGECSFGLKDNTAYPGWKICEKTYQNKGYGPKIINILIEYLFTNSDINSKMKIKKIFWDTMLENKRAQYVYENKLNIRKVGVQKDIWRDQLGNLRTSVDYEITREEFLDRIKDNIKYNNIIENEGREICSWKYDGEYSIYNLPDYDSMKEKNLGFTNPEKNKNYYSFYNDDKLIGFINLLNEEEAVFLGIGVNPKYTNIGYGQIIIKKAIELSEKLYGNKKIYLEVRTWNERAVNCYKKAGFTIVDKISQETAIGYGEFYQMEYKNK